jgi:hypothetical protein
VKKTVQRHAAVIKILSRAGKRAARAGNDELADAYHPAPGQIEGLPLESRTAPVRQPAVCARDSTPAAAVSTQKRVTPIALYLRHAHFQASTDFV